MDEPGHDRHQHGQVRRIWIVHADSEVSGDLEADQDAIQYQDQAGGDAADEDRRIAVEAPPEQRADEAADQERDAAPTDDERDERVDDRDGDFEDEEGHASRSAPPVPRRVRAEAPAAEAQACDQLDGADAQAQREQADRQVQQPAEHHDKWEEVLRPCASEDVRIVCQIEADDRGVEREDDDDDGG